LPRSFFSTGCKTEDFWEGSYSGIVRAVHMSRLANCDGSQ
jgi:hypothetical protein